MDRASEDDRPLALWVSLQPSCGAGRVGVQCGEWVLQVWLC